MSRKYVVMVTGGSGCLGQHVVKLLQTRATHVDEIRVIDIVPFVKKLDYEDRVPVRSYNIDISEMSDTSAFSGVTSVFHLASLVSVNNFPDYVGMRKVNVTGTQNILNACIEEGVTQVIYASTVDVVCGHDNIVDGTEENTQIPEKRIYDGYGSTKEEAERTVLSYNGKALKSGGVLHTVALRPTLIFGELDNHYFPAVFKNARSKRGVFIPFEEGTALLHQTYAGNVAWAFICAHQTLRNEENSALPEVVSSRPEVEDIPDFDSRVSVGGEFFFVTDDWEPRAMSQQVEPFLKAVGYRLSTYRPSFKLIYRSVKFAERFLRLISPLKKIDLGYSSRSVRYVNTSYTYNSSKLRRLLGYTPLYSPEESLCLANKYYVGLISKVKKSETERKK